MLLFFQSLSLCVSFSQRESPLRERERERERESNRKFSLTLPLFCRRFSSKRHVSVLALFPFSAAVFCLLRWILTVVSTFLWHALASFSTHNCVVCFCSLSFSLSLWPNVLVPSLLGPVGHRQHLFHSHRITDSPS